MRINDSRPLANEPLADVKEAEPSNLGEIKPGNGVISNVSVKYTMYLDGVVQAAPMAGEQAGTMKMQADMLQQDLQKAVDTAVSKKNVKWEGPDFDAAKIK